MAVALRALTPLAGFAPVAVLWGLPLAGGVAGAIVVLGDEPAWTALLAHPQVWPALILSLWTGTAALIASLAGAILVLVSLQGRRSIPASAGWALAIPHLAFAIGFGFLIMPSGLIARLFYATPPDWVTVSDPMGWTLIASLVLKETPFLIWIGSALLPRPGTAGQWRTARSLGHGNGSIWLRVVLPQLLPRLAWPAIAVWVYGATVVDMALVLGPTEPPTLAVLVWSDLNDADALANSRGAAGALLLSLTLFFAGAAAYLLVAASRPMLRRFLCAGPTRWKAPRIPGFLLTLLFAVIYAGVIVMLGVLSISGHWPFPLVFPQSYSLDAVKQLAFDVRPLATSLGLAFLTAITALTLAVLWLECVAGRFDRTVTLACVAALGLPALLIAAGQYQAFLRAGLTGTLTGLFLVHLTAGFAYVFIVLRAPFRAFDPRLRSAAYGLSSSGWHFWLKVKAPMLRAALWQAGAIGFAVSMGQFVAAQLIAAGRHTTLPMEAVTLSSGGNRSVTAAYALAMALPPALVFTIASLAGRPRWR